MTDTTKMTVEELREEVTHLNAIIAELLKDRERLEWLIKHRAGVCFDEKYAVYKAHSYRTWVTEPEFDTPRAAIDAAREGS